MGIYLAFIGQLNTTFGKPHPLTGRHNIYGQLVKFKTRKERDHFVNHYRCNDYNQVIPTNKKHAKRVLCAGMTQAEFDDMIDLYTVFYTGLIHETLK